MQRQGQAVERAALPPLTRPDVTVIIQCLQGQGKLAELRMSLAAAAVLHSLKTCARLALLPLGSTSCAHEHLNQPGVDNVQAQCACHVICSNA